MSLWTYQARRDFAQTPEPGAAEGTLGEKSIFVIQKHHASRLHYDFRLEVDGVLKSWAVPKGPSRDPADKRLAVQVEDHPLDYANFHGTIPKGQYGAGTVEIWDRGTYENKMAEKDKPLDMEQSLKKGHVEVELHGRKLKGGFALIRAKHLRGSDQKPQWLLVKMKDPAARRKETTWPSRRQSAGRSDGVKIRKAASPPKSVELTHPDKIMFPEAGLTKRDLFNYYQKMARRLLPWLADRPMTLERLPDGIKEGGPHFWQKNAPDYYPDWIPRVSLKSEEGKPVDYLLVNDRPTLLWLVNQGTVTFHPWLSRVTDLEHPDFVLFDLDPGEADFLDCIRIARTLRDILKKETVPAYVKTSGKTGLHLLTPPPAGADYDRARNWAQTVAQQVVEQLPQIATMNRRKKDRKGRVYIDVVQNALGHHVVPPYVARATANAGVSMPLGWRQLTKKLTPGRYTLRSVLRHPPRNREMEPLLK